MVLGQQRADRVVVGVVVASRSGTTGLSAAMVATTSWRARPMGSRSARSPSMPAMELSPKAAASTEPTTAWMSA